MNNTLSYHLQTFNGLTSSWPRTTFLRDTGDREPYESIRLDTDAQVQSGDYFVMLATKLDLLGRNIADYDIRADLETVVSDLIYLQDNYTITKNN